MKRTGATKLSTRLLIAGLRKKASAEKQKIWKAIAEAVSKPTRQRITVNVSKLAFLGKKFPGKTFIVPGKVLGKGTMEARVDVIALQYSTSAKKTIESKNGTATLLKEIVGKKLEASKLMIAA